MSKQFKPAIFAGHGGSDRGAVKYVVESEVNLKIVMYAAAYLRARGVEPVLPRTDDSYVSLQARANMAHAAEADCVVDLHNNAWNGVASGTETFVQQDSLDSHDLGRLIQRRLVDTLGRPDRGVKVRERTTGAIKMADGANDYYFTLRECIMPACIVECLFVDHQGDAALLADDGVLKRIGEDLGEALLAWAKGKGLLLGDPPSDWAAEAWAWGIENHITDGSKPQDAPTREQLVAMLHRYDKLKGG